MHLLLTLAIGAGEEYDSRQQGGGLDRCCQSVNGFTTGSVNREQVVVVPSCTKGL